MAADGKEALHLLKVSAVMTKVLQTVQSSLVLIIIALQQKCICWMLCQNVFLSRNTSICEYIFVITCL